MEAGRFVYVLTITAMVVGCYSSSLYEEWKDYKTTFNKTYLDSDDEEYRRFVWMENYRKIKQHNIEANMGLHTFWLNMNHLGDMSTDEINQVMNNLKPELLDRVEENNSHNVNTDGEGVPEMFQVDVNVDRKFSNRTEDVSGRVPDSIDWRKKGYVTAVKYQGYCGACYAFSATGALEGQHFRRTGKLVSLSEQNLVDCTYYNRYKDKGCHGGLMDHAFRYVIDNGGIDTETSYPYRATVSTCKFNSRTVGAKAKGYRDILPRGDENKLKEAVGTMGPVSIGIDAHSFWFHFYSYGVFDGWFCGRKLNHGVLAVGYGSEYGTDYWIVKNSWGWWWGDRGYVKMSRNKNNQCGIASLGSIPIV